MTVGRGSIRVAFTLVRGIVISNDSPFTHCQRSLRRKARDYPDKLAYYSQWRVRSAGSTALDRSK